ncbi:MAG TPA: hypothetical protein VGX27_14015 [Candidatus Dormibacteraeota bacterium]|nr:hypothetical protein [Candidatus Dormibacteraeota bacterium]
MRDAALPTLPTAVAILAIGGVLLLSHRHIARLWSTFYKRPIPTGFVYFYFYILGPIFILVCGALALLSALTIK